MKADFELLLKVKKGDGDLRRLFWDAFEKNNEISRLAQTDNLVCNFPEETPLSFKIVIKQSGDVLHCRLKAAVDVHWGKAYFYDKFRARIDSILGQYFEVTHYSSDLSGYYAKKCYPILFDYETNLRKIVYFIYHFYDIRDATSNRKKQKLNDYVENLDLSELERLLFLKSWLLVGNSYEFCDINKGRELYEKIQKLDSKPEFRSMWDISIRPFLPQQAIDERVIEKIRAVRNKVAHHKLMTFNDWKFCRGEVRDYANKFHDMQKGLIDRKFRQTPELAVSFQEALQAMSKHFRGIVDSMQLNSKLTGDIIATALKDIRIPKIDIPKIVTPAIAEIADQSARMSKLMQNVVIPRLDVPRMYNIVLQNDEQTIENDKGGKG
ncbi:hypothetical protein KP781_07140 [Streptococcus equi subsp. zooepidemicus]|uniref:Uncharacterized protein n=1 Tax=Streptococcus equi subsp. zooepidemicus (strain H70) TaxID=553483 RepID=C0MH48_STRS7|nr:hypothetical protein [Streptococcus equi]MCD3388174.1 hypothetical protein [Streptococcus equi subsp. zooepidemicus]MCD3399486.1 hypothetical protein [Streptococcus equi subsp. zooepidemicus]MCD3451309.1 hypothetical protein [Streptococcus equi subsp. zooepidemicus]MCD3465393.1 hypothetical protein [Streptococcus equi subsp. zooepidemicus]CAW98326.1 hypothetical protein SZO_04250 [Streptococcus equi subsp. zooepidemicus]